MEKVNQFKYLGSNVTNNNNISSTINHVINKGKKCNYGLRNLWVSKLLLKGTQGKIYKTLIRTAVLYGCQSWTVMNTDEGKLSVSEKKLLRKFIAQIVSIGNGE